MSADLSLFPTDLQQASKEADPVSEKLHLFSSRKKEGAENPFFG
jgi:hypothetical protein